MPKNIKPVEGQHHSDMNNYLKFHLEDYNEDTQRVVCHAARVISIRLNPDICLSAEQRECFVELLKKYADNPDGRDISDSEISKIVIELNGYRLACRNCLNTECDYRDPNHPAEETKKRAEQFKGDPEQIGVIDIA